MKELSIEDKAKRYDEALARANEMIKDMTNVGGVAKVDDIQYLFPELKESEDERIRKELLEFIKNDYTEGWIPSEKQKSWIAWLEKQGEQKPADKVEPKFKVEKDKWYVCTSQYCNCIEGRNYKATSDGRIIDDYGTEYDMHSDAYQWFRPWTIQDAKDGDVLLSPTHRLIWIYKDNEHYHACVNMNYLTENVATDGLIGIPNDVCPANREQRSILFQKMKEAGYEWDAEKKELKKVEQPSAWSEEDEEMLNTFLHKLEVCDLLSNKESIWIKNKLKSLKDRVGNFDDGYKVGFSAAKHNQWKPSEEQIKALTFACIKNVGIDKSSIKALYDLKEQLKQL